MMSSNLLPRRLSTDEVTPDVINMNVNTPPTSHDFTDEVTNTNIKSRSIFDHLVADYYDI